MTRTQLNTAAAVMGAATACLLIIGASNAALLFFALQHGEWGRALIFFVGVCVDVWGLWQCQRVMSVVRQEAIRRREE